MSDEPQPMSPEEIDALFASLREQQSGPEPPDAAHVDAAGSATGTEAASAGATAADGAGDADGSVAPGSAAEEDEVLVAEDEVPVDSRQEAGGPLEQDDIDALLGELGVSGSGDEEAGSASATDATAASSPSAGTVDAGADRAVEAVEAVEADEADEADGADGAVGAEATAPPGGGTDGAGQQSGTVDQDDIDALLSEMGIGDDAAASTVESSSSAKGGGARERSQQLSKEDLQRLIDKHGNASDDGTEQSITEDDIDDLVAQMSSASGVPDQKHITEVLKNRESDIDALLEDVESGVEAMDAVAASQGGIRGTAVSADGMPMVPMGTVSGEELKGTRYLLVSAVCLLAMCAVTLGFIVSAINGLTQELEHKREASVRATDDFAEDLERARDYLASQDAADRRKGVRLLDEDMRRLYPEHEDAILLVLARHFHGRNEHAEAKGYYRQVLRGGGLLDEPQVYLDYGRTLVRVDDLRGARRVLMHLLANEDYYTDPELYANGLSSEEEQRHRRIVRQAYLLLGRVDLVRGGESEMVAGVAAGETER